MSIKKKFKSLDKSTKRIIYACFAISGYALVGFILLPLIVKPILIDTLSEQLNRKTQLQALKFNPFTFSVTLHKLTISGKHDENFFSFNQLIINYSVVALFNKTIAFDEISLIQPKINIKLLANGDYNFQDLIASNTASDDSKPTKASDWTFAIDKFRYTKGSIDFSDEHRTTPFAHQFNDISIALDNFSTKAGIENMHHISAQTARGTLVDWRGNFSLFPIKSSGDLQIKGDLMVVSDYLQDEMLVTIVNGKLSINSHYDFQYHPKQSVLKLSNTYFDINNLEVQRNKDQQKVLSWENFHIALAKFDTVSKEIIINTISSQGVAINLSNKKLVDLDFSDFFVLQNAKESLDEKLDRKDHATTETNQTEWNLHVVEVKHNNAELLFNDQAVSPSTRHKVTINAFTINNLKPFSHEEALISANLLYNDIGQIKLNGTLKPASKQVAVKLTIIDLNLNDFQSYLNPVAQINVVTGKLSTTLNIELDAITSTPELNLTGDIKLSETKLIDKTLNEEFLSWQALSIKGLQFSYPKQKIAIEAINIEAPYLRLIMNQGGQTNIQQLAVEQTNNSTKPEQQAKDDALKTTPEELQAVISEITIDNAKMDFSDHSLLPKFSAGIYNLNGYIKGLSTEANSRARVNLIGKVDRYAPVTIKGEINPLSHNTFSDIKILFKGIELTTFTPYSGKFAGYKIDKGKLSLVLDYKLSNNKLVAENQVILDQLTLGEAVDSENATSLPISFALSLLKDRNGVIDFNLPIRGDIDNPEFHYGSLIWGALGNLIVGMVSSPFKALANLVSDDQENFDQVTFNANSSELAASETTKLDALSKALIQRPELYLEIRGLSSPLIDHDDMAYSQVLKQLNLPEKSISTPLSSEEQAVLLSYYASVVPEQNKFNKETTGEEEGRKADKVLTAEAKNIVLTEAIEFLMNATKINEADYIMLAKQRATIIQAYLIEVGQVPSANIFLLDSSIQVNPDDSNVIAGQLTLPLGLKAK